jgi:hypothetical protein
LRRQLDVRLFLVGVKVGISRAILKGRLFAGVYGALLVLFSGVVAIPLVVRVGRLRANAPPTEDENPAGLIARALAR